MAVTRYPRTDGPHRPTRYRSELLGNRSSYCSTRDGRQLVAAVARGTRLFIRVVDIASDTLNVAVMFMTPEPLGRYLRVTVQNDVVWIDGGSYATLVLALPVAHVIIHSG